MKAILICRSDRTVEDLRSAVEAEGFQVARAVLRKGGQALSGLLGDGAADLAIVESAADHADLSAIEAAAGRHPELALILLSPSRDAEVLIGAMRAGVREVLVAPPAAGELQAALRRLAQRKPGGSGHGHVVAFIACKGGSGATFIATNVAYVLATEQGLDTALIDLDLQYGDASFFVSDSPVKSGLADLTRQVERLDAKLLSASMQRIAPKFWLLAAPESPEAALSITAAQIERVLEVAADSHEVLVLDVERMIDAVAVKALDRAELVFLVLQNMLPHVRDAKRLVHVLRTLGYPDTKLRLVVNRCDSHGALTLAQIEEAVGLKVAYTLPDSPKDVSKAINTGMPLVKLDRDSPVAKSLRAIAASLAGKPKAAAAHGWIGRLIGEHD